MFYSFTKWWLTIILLFIPFQSKIVESLISWNPGVAGFLKKLDEITVILFLSFAIVELYKKRKHMNSQYLLLTYAIIIFAISGFISGLINSNSALITSMGIFEYIKYFFVIFIYAVFFRGMDEFKKVFRLLLIVTVFIGIAAFIQEVGALYYRYVLDIIYPTSGFHFDSELTARSLIDGRATSIWRLGIYRADSFTPHYNVLGFYCLLILTIYLYLYRKVNPIFFLALYSGVFVSVSRTCYAGFMFMAGLHTIKRRRWLVLSLIPILILIIKMSVLPDFDIVSKSKYLKAERPKQELSHEEIFTEENYRTYAFEKSIEVWKDNPFLGVGPGKFGSAAAIKYRSHVFEEHSFTGGVIRGLDQFWPQVLAETGIVGAGAFAGMLFVIFLTLVKSRQKTTSDELRNVYIGLTIYMAVVILYAFNSTLITVEILFIYCALIGMSLGVEEDKKWDEENLINNSV